MKLTKEQLITWIKVSIFVVIATLYYSLNGFSAQLLFGVLLFLYVIELYREPTWTSSYSYSTEFNPNQKHTGRKKKRK